MTGGRMLLLGLNPHWASDAVSLFYHRQSKPEEGSRSWPAGDDKEGVGERCRMHYW